VSHFNPSIASNALRIARMHDLLSMAGRDGHRFRVCVNGRSEALTITDCVQSLPGERVTQMSKPFFTSRKSGFGLGLLLVQRIVHGHRDTTALLSRGLRGRPVAPFPGGG
jgi:nitrogen fixation/metabolism regulation signal transduction histidine kinase